jgi:hypothetical protein
MRPSDLSSLQSTVRVDSYSLLAILLPGLVVYSVVLVDMFSQVHFDVVDVTYALLGFVFLYGVWVSTYVYDIEPDQVVVHRFFGLLPSEIIPNSAIRAFRQKPNYTGQASVFEIKFAPSRTVTLHIYQRKFELAVSALKAFNPTVPSQELNKWGL